MTLTIELDLDMVQVDLHVKILVHTSNGSVVRVMTDGHTDRQTGLILLPRTLTREVNSTLLIFCNPSLGEMGEMQIPQNRRALCQCRVAYFAHCPCFTFVLISPVLVHSMEVEAEFK